MKNSLRRSLVFLAFLVPVIAILLYVVPSRATASNPPSIYWGAAINGARYGDGWVPQDMRGVSAFEANAGKNVSIIHFGLSWQKSDGSWNSFYPSQFDNIRNHGSIPFFAWLSSAGDGASQPAFANRVIYNGTYDSYITEWATAAKNWGHPFFLRLDHEMDGWWYPWGEGQTSVGGPIVNGNQPGDYVKMWRHVRDIFTQVGATNVTWVWCPNHESTSSQYPSMASLYPGDNYVDWICLDSYNRYSGTWLSFNQALTGQGTSWMANAYSRITSVAPTKPLILGEFASFEDSTDATRKANWITDALVTQIPNNFPAIKGIIWYNSGSDSETLQIESSTNANAAFAAGIASSVYAANDFASLAPSVIQPLSNSSSTPTATPTRLSSPTPTFTSTPRLATATPTPAGATTTVRLGSIADTFINSSYANTSYGFNSSLQVNSSPTQKMFLKFDLSSLAGKTLKSAVLKVKTTTNAQAGSAGRQNWHYVYDNLWSETYMTYNNTVAASSISSAVMGSLSNTVPDTAYSITLDVPTVQKRVGSKFSMMADTTSTDNLFIHSRESTTVSYRPVLIITY